MNNEKQYYIISSKNFATTIFNMTGLQYYVYENQKDDTKQVYSFENTPEFREALTAITSLRKELRARFQ